MTACLAGSALTGLMLRRVRIESFMVAVFVISAVALSVPFLFHLRLREEGVGEWHQSERVD